MTEAIGGIIDAIGWANRLPTSATTASAGGLASASTTGRGSGSPLTLATGQPEQRQHDRPAEQEAPARSPLDLALFDLPLDLALGLVEGPVDLAVGIAFLKAMPLDVTPNPRDYHAAISGVPLGQAGHLRKRAV
jgi:hypothetical protein